MLSEKEVEESNYKHIFYKNLPDRNTEFFWYNFKESIINTLHSLPSETKNSLKKYDIIDNLYKLSNNLNQLQNNGEYNNINNKIEDYIRDIARILFLPHSNYYHFNIFLTNLKRWDTWVLELPDKKKHKYEWLKSSDTYTKDDYFMIFLKFKKYMNEYGHKENQVFNDALEFKFKKYQYWEKLENIFKPQSNLTYQQINKEILDDIYNFILKEKYLKPTLLIELSHYYPIIKDLKSIGCINQDIPDSYQVEKAIKKGIIHLWK